MTGRAWAFAVACGVLAAACGHKGAPTVDAGGAAVANATAVDAGVPAVAGPAPWLTFRVDPKAPALAEGQAMLAVIGARCGVDPSAVTAVDGFIARPFRLVVDVRGKVSVKGVECLLAPLGTWGGSSSFARRGAEGPLFGQTTEPAPRVSALQGDGVRIELDAEPGRSARGGPPAPALPEGAIALALTVGPADAPWGLTFAAAETATLVLVAPTEAQATAVLTWLEASIERAAEPTLRTLVRTREGRTVRIVSASTATLADAVRTHLVEAFRLPAGSMRPSLLPGDQVFIAKGVFAGTATRGDVVVYRTPTRPAYVKRVVAIAGDTVAIVDGAVHVNGQPVAATRTQAGWTDEEVDPVTGALASHAGDVWTETVGARSWQTLRPAEGDGVVEAWSGSGSGAKVPAGHVFVLGDDRANSMDSRHEGPVPLTSIVGHAVLVHFSSGPRGVRSERLGRFVR